MVSPGAQMELSRALLRASSSAFSQFLEPAVSLHCGHGVFSPSGDPAVSRTASAGLQGVSSSHALRSAYIPPDCSCCLGVIAGLSVFHGSWCGAEVASLRICVWGSAGLTPGSAVSRVEAKAARTRKSHLVLSASRVNPHSLNLDPAFRSHAHSHFASRFWMDDQPRNLPQSLPDASTSH